MRRLEGRVCRGIPMDPAADLRCQGRWELKKRPQRHRESLAPGSRRRRCRRRRPAGLDPWHCWHLATASLICHWPSLPRLNGSPAVKWLDGWHVNTRLPDERVPSPGRRTASRLTPRRPTEATPLGKAPSSFDAITSTTEQKDKKKLKGERAFIATKRDDDR